MQNIWVVVAALAIAGCAAAQAEMRPNPKDARSDVPPVEYRSAFEGYRAFADQDLADWRKANEEVSRPAEHGGHK